MTPPLNTVVFDLGNVLLPFDYQRAITRLLPQCGIAPDKVSSDLSKLSTMHECGQISEDDFFVRLTELLQYKGGRDFLHDAWCDIFTVNVPMVEFMQSLAGKLRLCALSNIGETHARHIEKSYDFLQLLTDRFYSFRVGAMKPDPRIYRHAIWALQLDNPASALFIDDKPENVKAGEDAGLQAIGYDAAEHEEFLARARPIMQGAERMGALSV